MENKYHCKICSQEISAKEALAQSYLSDSLNADKVRSLQFEYVVDKICPECKQNFRKE